MRLALIHRWDPPEAMRVDVPARPAAHAGSGHVMANGSVSASSLMISYQQLLSETLTLPLSHAAYVHLQFRNPRGYHANRA